MKLENRVSLVTGAASGIGRATALRFAQEGAVVVAVDLNQAAVNEVQQQIETAGGRALALAVDVSQEGQVKDAIAQHQPNTEYCPTLEAIKQTLQTSLHPGDIVIFLTAGNLNQVIPEVMSAYQSAPQPEAALT